MKAMEDLAQVLDMLHTRAAEYKAFERTLAELNQSMVDLMSRAQTTPADIERMVTSHVATLMSAADAKIAALEARLVVLEKAPRPAAQAGALEWAVDAPLDSMGRPSGKMTIKRVQ